MNEVNERNKDGHTSEAGVITAPVLAAGGQKIGTRFSGRLATDRNWIDQWRLRNVSQEQHFFKIFFFN